MFCSLAHFIIISDQNFFDENTGKYKFFKDLSINQKNFVPF